MKTVEWRPDTCKCILQLQLKTQTNNYTAVESVTDKFGTTYNKAICSRHSHITDLQDHYQSVLQENQTKNQVYTSILELNQDTPQQFYIDYNGVLTFIITGYLTQEQIDMLLLIYPNVIFT